ncbi:virulence RhuM family protein, partial [Faecalicoccus acidiformans]|uniref:virulence RhuM family protein n=1 Tax=Faecalicoccus acidiformans TaxID=915173 RepID=UPI003208CD98
MKRGDDKIKNDIVMFKNGELELEVNVTPEKETVWLTQDQMSSLFDTARSSIAYHINNIFKEGELQRDTSVEIFDRSLGKASRPPMYYNLDVIISVGYRVKSQRGIAFRKWATSILKDYMIKGYAVNKKRLEILNKTVEIQ